MIHLFVNGILFDQTFDSWDEVFEYLADQTGLPVDDDQRLRLYTGHSERFGSDWYMFMPEGNLDVSLSDGLALTAA